MNALMAALSQLSQSTMKMAKDMREFSNKKIRDASASTLQLLEGAIGWGGLWDRLFNLLKIEYRNNNVYTMDQLLPLLDKADDVKAVRVREGDIKYFDTFEDTLYKRIQPVTVNRSHWFRSNATTLV
jgi:hypothetical protein